MKAMSATRARQNLYKLIDEAGLSHEPVTITGKRNNAVLVSEKTGSLSTINPRNERFYTRRNVYSCIKMPEGSSVVTWSVVYTKQAVKDAARIKNSGLKEKTQELLDIMEKNPFQNPPPFEKLVGDLAGTYSRRINIQHRLVYQVLKKEKTVKVLRMWTHYE